ncbi:hypothetical protein [Mycolicibacterium sp. XJ775]
MVNLLALTDATVRPKLTNLHEALRAAHAAMDGQRIRELSATQRTLVQDLTRAGFAAAELPDPTAALRDDVTGTLQAAIADPEVAARLGRLSRAEEWSGFGDFGASSVVITRSRPDTGSSPGPTPPPPTPREKQSDEDTAAVETARRRRDATASELGQARAANDDALAALKERRRKVETARRRYEKVLETLTAAQRDLDAAEAQLDLAQQSADELQNRVRNAEAAVAQAESQLIRLTGE